MMVQEYDGNGHRCLIGGLRDQGEWRSTNLEGQAKDKGQGCPKSEATASTVTIMSMTRAYDYGQVGGW